MKIQLIRHATLWLEYAGLNILVDPMLMDPEEMPAFPNTPNNLRNPRAALPETETEYTNPDLVIVTHTHIDHWDAAAADRLRKDVPLLCQPGDENVFLEAGFTSVHPVDEKYEFHSVRFARTPGQHGTGKSRSEWARYPVLCLRLMPNPYRILPEIRSGAKNRRRP